MTTGSKTCVYASHKNATGAVSASGSDTRAFGMSTPGCTPRTRGHQFRPRMRCGTAGFPQPGVWWSQAPRQGSPVRIRRHPGLSCVCGIHGTGTGLQQRRSGSCHPCTCRYLPWQGRYGQRGLAPFV